MVDAKDFILKISEILEIESENISLETDFRKDVPDWDSLKGFAILVMVEDEYSKTIKVNEFLEMKTIGDIFSFVQKQPV